MLDTYITLEPNVSCNHIIKTQLLYPLLENCHNPGVYDIILNLLEPFTSKYDIFGQIQVYFWNSCLEKDFFGKMLNLIIKEKTDLSGHPIEEETNDNLNILDQAEKHYSQQKTQMIKMEMVKRLGGISSFLKNVTEFKSEDPNFPDSLGTDLDTLLGPLKFTSEEILKEYLNLAEFQGKTPDIDNLKSFIKAKKGLASKELQRPNSKDFHDKILKISKEPEKLMNTITSMGEVDQLRATTSSLDMEKGFTSSKLMTLYPTRFLVEHRARLDNIANKSEYQLSSLKESEKIAFSASSLLNTIISTILDYEDNVESVGFLKIKRVEGVVSIPDMFLHKEGMNFEKILMVF